MEHNKILVADDELALRFLISETLADEGYEVAEAADGAEAKAMLERDEYDVIVLDYMMPEHTGVELCAWLRSGDSPNRDKPVILLTAKALEKDKEAAAKAGVDEYLVKPFSPLHLLDVVDRLKKGGG